MHHTKLIDKLVRELSYRVGVPNIHNKEHQSIMSEILSEWGEYDAKQKIFEFLTEEPRKFKNPILNRTIKYKDKNGKGIVGNLLTTKKESPGRIAAEKMLGGLSDEDRDAINKEVGAQGTQKKIDFPKDDSTDTTDDSAETPTTGNALKPGTDFAKKAKELEDRVSGKKQDGTSTKAKPLSTEELVSKQQETARLRDAGEAGAGGEAASQGESRYCNAVDTLNYNEYGAENREQISKVVQELKAKKKLSAPEERLLNDLNFEKPYNDDAYDYLATREVYAEQEFQRMKDMPKPNVLSSSSGFGGSENGYKDWMRAAFDGALATQELLGESRMDTSKPFNTIQSTSEIDDGVQADLEERANDENSSKEDRDYYAKELKSFKKFRKYHDTYVVGQDENGRKFIVSVSNKKSSQLDDPQNNTTPNARFQVMKREFGEDVAKKVTLSINDGIRMVTTVAKESLKSSVKVTVDDDFVNVAVLAGKKLLKGGSGEVGIEKRGLKRNKSKKTGKPSPGHEFGCFLDDKKISEEQWNNMSDKEKITTTQQFMSDDDWHTTNGTSVPYSPYTKLFIKVGEVSTGGHNELKKIRKELEARGQSSSIEASSVAQAGSIKQKEQSTVKIAHQNVVNQVGESDKKLGFPKDGKNGPHTQAYVGTVMSALHFDSYIDMPDEDNDKMVIQMGVVGAKPSNIRNCLAKQSGYKMPPGDRDGLKKHLRETCSIDAETGSIVIKSKGEDGNETKIAEDTWRTAGTSQKVASAFGDDMKKCVKSKVKSQRTNPKGK
jgi:hypothetical protein